MQFNLWKKIILLHLFLIPVISVAQLKWQNVDSLFQPLPASVHIYKTTDLLDGKPNIAYYLEADLKDKKLEFTVDTTFKRRLTPSKFYDKNDKPLLVVNTTFFSFATNQNLNVVIKNKKLVGFNIHTNKSLLKYRSPLSQTMKTMTPDVSSLANRNAADAAPPLLIPAKIPSTFANCRVIAMASSCDTSITLSTRLGSKILGTYSGDQRRMPGIDDPSVGWQPTI